jgi:hypothetical protein
MNIAKNANEIQRLMREYFEILYSKMLENLEEMDKFLYTFDLLKFNQEDTNQVNRSTSIDTAEIT